MVVSFMGAVKLQTIVCALCCCSGEFPVSLVSFIKDYQSCF